jgi:hypothetical protein
VTLDYDTRPQSDSLLFARHSVQKRNLGFKYEHKESQLIKSCSGIVAALAVLCCCSQAEGFTAVGASNKLMGDRPGAQRPEWVLYEDMPEEGESVSFNQAGDGDGALEICQSEDGTVGTVTNTGGRVTCRTDSGDHYFDFYVLQLAEGADVAGLEQVEDRGRSEREERDGEGVDGGGERDKEIDQLNREV